MKKLFFAALSAIALFASCTMSDADFLPTVEATGDFTAQFAETRTELDGNAVVWREDDLLTIFTKTSHNRKYQVKELSDNGRTATFGYVSFTGNNSTKISSNYALYPYDADATLTGGVVTTTLHLARGSDGCCTRGNSSDCACCSIVSSHALIAACESYICRCCFCELYHFCLSCL